MYQIQLQPQADARAQFARALRPNRIVLALVAAMGNVSMAYAGPSPAPASPAPASPVPPAPSPNPGPAAGPAPASLPASPAEVDFSPTFLGANSDNYNLESYQKGNVVPAGDFRVDLFVNGYSVGRETVTFKQAEPGKQAQACLTEELLTLMGVDVGKLTLDGAALPECVDLATAIPGAFATYDSGLLRLDVSIPQIALSRRPRDYVDPKMWDQGITAFTLGYSFNASHGTYQGGRDSDSAYLGLNAGLNIGPWRIRSQSSYTWDRASGSNSEVISTYAQRDITRLKSQLTVGDSFTSGRLFDSTRFRGAQLATDERMRPDSINGYAPTIRGNAETNAKVEIFQQGYVIYETTVAPGAFEISDLYPNSMGGDLKVVVTEADGRKKTYKVPYAAVPQLLRPGIWNYSATIGRVRHTFLTGDAPMFLEGTYQRGINNWMTGYVGGQATTQGMYRSALVGAAFNTRFGAVSVDVTGSQARFQRSSEQRKGYSARITYNKNIPATRTDFALAAYRYSSEGYVSLNDAVWLNDSYGRGIGQYAQYKYQNQRSKFQFTVSQRFSDRGGSLFLSGSRAEYWDNQTPVDFSFQAGWSGQLKTGGYSISANRSKLSGGGYDTGIYATYSVPLGRASRHSSAPQLSLSGNHTAHGKSMQAGVTGSLGDRQQYSYGAHTNFGEGTENSLNVNAAWRAAYANLGSSYSYSNASQQASFSANGGLVIHSGGITFAPQLGDTIAVIKAKGAKGARLASDNASKVDGRGFLIATNLMPYRMNEVNLDPKGSSFDVELQNTRQQIAPRAGAVVSLNFATTSGKVTLVRSVLENGEPVPFGAQVKDQSGHVIGLFGQGGQAFVREPQSGASQMTVTWGNEEACLLDIPASVSPIQEKDIDIVRATCRTYRGK